jgi:hypothetical protein
MRFMTLYKPGREPTSPGPFTESKELIAGYAIIQVKSKAAAIELTKRFLTVMGEGEGESEIRQMQDAPAYPPA